MQMTVLCRWLLLCPLHDIKTFEASELFISGHFVIKCLNFLGPIDQEVAMKWKPKLFFAASVQCRRHWSTYGLRIPMEMQASCHHSIKQTNAQNADLSQNILGVSLPKLL